MLASILVEAWDLYSIGFVLVFIKDQFNPDPFVLGLAAAATQLGALIGALIGGWLVDKLGRRVMFLGTMILFIVLALAQSMAWSIEALIVIRFFLGLPLGSEPAIGFSYIMDAMSKSKRELMGTRWQFMFGLGNALAAAVVTLLILTIPSPEAVWRIALGIGAIPAAIILLLRFNLPETAIWLIRQGRFREAKVASQKLYGDSLDMLPDEDVVVPKPAPAAFLADLRTDPVRMRASVHSWLANFLSTAQFQSFGFYLPLLFAALGVSSLTGNNLILVVLYSIAALSGWLAPSVAKRIGHRGVSILGFSIVLVSLLFAALALQQNWIYVVPFAAAVMIYGEYLSISNVMTIATIVAKPEYRGTAGGFSYAFAKLAAFLAIFLFPSITAALGQSGATLLVSSFALIGLLSAIFILPEVFGYDSEAIQQRQDAAAAKKATRTAG
ncbi:MFS transporter [Compostimonas suwonensis]|nr:MFS transporter [Compostimonas suwonensis]